jgi:Uma2 family endonuclease
MATTLETQVSKLTYADLSQLPDDGKRYELIDGELFVTSAPGLSHQRAARNLVRLLHWVCPEDHEVLFAPFEWFVDDGNAYQPDLLVARSEDLTPRNLTRPPMLAVEILSPSTRSRDAVLKRHVYARAGLPHYWIVDPDIPSITTYDLVDGNLVERHVARAHERLALERPFVVTIHPSDVLLVR